MNTRPVFVEKKMLKQHGIRRLFGAGALFFGLFLLVAVVSWVFREEVYQPGGYGSGNELALYLEENGADVRRGSGENPYGDGMDGVHHVQRWTLSGGAWDDLPEEDRSFLMIFADSPAVLDEWTENLSPSGGRLFVRTGVFTFRTIELGYDESRRVWEDGHHLIYYNGGQERVAELLSGYAGEPVAHGRWQDSPEMVSKIAAAARMLVTWEDFGYLMVCIVAGALAAVCLFFALRPPKERAPGDLTAFSARMEQEGVTLVAFGKLTGGPYGELPGQERLMAWLVWKGNREYEREVREAERQMGFSFPENLLAVYFFPSHRKAMEASHRIAPAGDRLKDGGVPLGFSYRRRVYRAGKLIAYYAGEERAVYEALEKICGKPFAGIGVRKGTEE